MDLSAIHPKPEEDAVDVAPLLEATGAREHRVFAGNVDRGRLTLPERAIVRALRVPTGDYRDWEDVAGWARNIAAQVTGSKS